MQVNIPLLFAALVAFVLIFHITIKMRWGFWYYQPVVKTYQFWASLSPPAIIAPSLPTPTPYFINNPRIIATKFIDTIDQQLQTAFVDLVAGHYLRTTNGNIYSPTIENIMPYFRGHNAACFISLYYQPIVSQLPISQVDCRQKATMCDTDKESGAFSVSIDVNPEIVGAITSRPLLVTYNDGGATKDIGVYYVDFLCVNRLHRRKGIAARLIQTHEYWQRQWNRQVAVSLFKHETDVLQGVVPLTTYTTVGFYSNAIGNGVGIGVAPPYKMGTIKTSNMPDLYDFMQKCRNDKRWKVFISTSIANVLSLLESKNIYIHVITDMDTKKIVAAYFYKNTCVSWDAVGNKVLMLEGSLSLLPDNEPLFMAGFMASCQAIVKKHKEYGVCGVEGISDNVVICNYLQGQIKPIVQTPTAYFFYNFRHPTVAAGNAFILH